MQQIGLIQKFYEKDILLLHDGANWFLYSKD